jgi:L-glyceraldehyde 3-phosphate reductase
MVRMSYTPDANRYKSMTYNRCGRSGLRLPAISLGLWQNFGEEADDAVSRDLIATAFDLGITHFDLANNYGPPPGSAEKLFGSLLAREFGAWRDEMIISTKAGYLMWPGPYGEWGSRKYLLASLEQSLQRLGLDYVDIFYHHRPDPETPLEETMLALDATVRQGKALYVGISNYPADLARAAARLLRELRTPFVIHQPRYSLLDRWIEKGLLDVAGEEGFGLIVFSPLAQGVLSGKYAQGIPADSRAGRGSPFLTPARLPAATIAQAQRLAPIAAARGQSLAQMALAWVLRDPRVTSALVGASKPAQVRENVDALQHRDFSADELAAVERALVS